MSAETRINAIEANALLLLLDDAVGTDKEGKVMAGANLYGLTSRELQILRDKLFAVHEHIPN